MVNAVLPIALVKLVRLARRQFAHRQRRDEALTPTGEEQRGSRSRLR
jgi:hypothetical protein